VPPPAPESSSPVLSPEEILALDGDGADRLLDRLEGEVPVRPGAEEAAVPTGAVQLLVFGDTHGDWRSTLEVARLFERDPARHMLIGLGDYIDRPPDDCPNGSVANALYLLGLSARHPDRVLLLQGNHETTRRIPVLPHDLPEEVDDLWGPEADRYQRLLGLLERGPLALTLPNGLYLAHAGFPAGDRSASWREAFRQPTDDLLYDLVWRDASQSRFDRGLSTPFREKDLAEFLDAIGARVFVRGHDPDLNGRRLDQDRCLTLHTTRVYEMYGGVLFARAGLERPVRSAREIALVHASTEGKSFGSAV
jgi:hypothetical protein